MRGAVEERRSASIATPVSSTRRTRPCTRWSRWKRGHPASRRRRAGRGRGGQPACGAPLLPRGGGTSLTGQTVNRARGARLLALHGRACWRSTVRAVGACAAGAGAGRAEPSRALAWGCCSAPTPRPRTGPPWAACWATTPAARHSIAYGLTVEHVIEIQRDPRRRYGPSPSATLTPAEFEAKTRAPGLEGQIYREVARIRDAVRATRSRALSAALAPRLRLQPRRADQGRPAQHGAARSSAREGTLPHRASRPRCGWCAGPRRTAVDVIHYHDMQEALESSQAILETGPYAVELTDKMILDLRPRRTSSSRKRMGFVQGDPAAILMRRVRGRHRTPRCKAKVEELEARRARERFGYASHIAPDAGRAAVHLEAAQGGARPAPRARSGDAKPIAFIEDTAVDPKHLPAFVPRFTRDHGQARRRRRLLRPLLGGLPAHPPAHQPQDRARARAGPGDGGGDLRPGARVRRRDLRASTATAGRGAPTSSACSGPTIVRRLPETRRPPSIPGTS